ncbi:MAG TPA: GGDEF domain-containing protein [Usitatibacter sp.]|nr:GGDEF domain-containing protein [Usitatibacter sp.]
MVSKVSPGTTVLERIAVYRRFDRVARLRESYAGKFAFAAFVGIFVPLAVFAVWLLMDRADWIAMYPALAALFLACFAGFLWMLWVLRELLAPVEITAEALREFIERRRVPDLPTGFPDTAGALMEGTQYTLAQLNDTINRLERVSDTDQLTGLYNRRAGEKRLGEEVARAERDLQTFQLALFDINDFGKVNDLHGHSAGDACISHVAALLQLNTRRGDWLARWGGDEFVVGLHRNRALRKVVARLVKAVESSPCEIAPGRELTIRLSCGVAEYRFGSGATGLLADTDHAVYAAKELARGDGLSHVCYRSELDLPRASAETVAG